jgi:phage gp36-like protein
MSYATKQDMIDRFGEEEIIAITDRATPPAGTIDDDVLSDALSAASAEVDSFIGLRVVTPVNPVPGDLVNRTCIIARYRLSDPATDRVRNDYTDTISFLKMVGAGTATLGDVAMRATSGGGGSPQVSAGCRTFTNDTLRGL